jgi:hypothetical protein
MSLLKIVPVESEGDYGQLAYLPTIDVFVGLYETVIVDSAGPDMLFDTPDDIVIIRK